MDLGIAGRTAAVAAGSAGLGLASAQRPRRRRGPRRHLRPGPGSGRPGAWPRCRRSRAATSGLVADVGDPGGRVRLRGRRRRCAGSVARHPRDQRRRSAAGHLRVDPARCLRPGARAEPPVGRGHVPGRGAGDAGARAGAGSWPSPRSPCSQPIGTLILSNTARAGATGFLKTLATEVARRRRDGELGAARPPRHRPPRRPARRRPGRGRRRRCPPGASAIRPTSAPSSPSCAPTRPSSSPAPPSRSTAARTPACSSSGLPYASGCSSVWPMPFRHIVLLSLDDTCEVEALVEDLRAMATEIPSIRRFDVGNDVGVVRGQRLHRRRGRLRRPGRVAGVPRPPGARRPHRQKIRPHLVARTAVQHLT